MHAMKTATILIKCPVSGESWCEFRAGCIFEISRPFYNDGLKLGFDFLMYCKSY